MIHKATKICTLSATIVIPFVLHGCSSTLPSYNTAQTDKLLHRFTDQELAKEENTFSPISLPATSKSSVETSLSHRMEEINTLTPANDPLIWETLVGLNLHQEETQSTRLSIDEAVALAIENNLEIQISSLQPSIAKQAVIANEAAFDFVFGADSSFRKTSTPQQQMLIGGIPLSTSESSSKNLEGKMSLAKKFYGGGTISASTDITKTNNTSSGTSLTPNPAWKTIGSIDFSQPLLRNFGKTVNLSEIRLSEITHKQAEEDVQETIQSVVTATIQSYLNLALRWKTLQVNIWLLNQGEKVVKTLDIRRSYDAGEADYAQAVATVQKRRAEVVSQQAALHKASDEIKKILNTESFSLESETVVKPSGVIEPTPISISFRQAVLTAIENRPDLRRQALSVSAKAINMETTDNARLPQLDFQAQLSFDGLDDNVGGGYKEVFNADYVNYLIGLSFQVHLGNRSAEAKYTSARLQKNSEVTKYKQVVQQIILDVKTALRDIKTNAELIQANKTFRIAQAENLRALLAEEETLSGLTPTFLNLKLQTQSGLASARTAEITSIINYNKSIADLNKAMGTTLSEYQIKINDDLP